MLGSELQAAYVNIRPLQLHVLVDVRSKALLEVLYIKLLAFPKDLLATGSILGWDKDVRDNLDHTITGNAIVNGDAGEAVNSDRDKRSVTGDVNSKVLVGKDGRKVIVVVWRASIERLVLASVVVESIGVQSLVDDDVILEESLEVLLAVLAEQEGIDAWAKLLESEVGRSEECTALMWVIGAVDFVPKSSLAESKFKGAELTGKQIDDGSDVGWRDKDGVDPVNNTVRTEDVDGYQSGIEVDGRSLKSYTDGKTLLVTEILLWRVQSWNGVAV